MTRRTRAPATRAYPFIFSGASVRAILAGTKTQTRRVVARRNVFICGRHAPALPLWEALDFNCAFVDLGPSPAGNPGPYLKVAKHDDASVQRVYSRLWTGDRLWVRETWARRDGTRCVAYRADGECGAWAGDGGGGRLWLRHGGVMGGEWARPETWRGQSYGLGYFGGRWRPSIHMPRWASRITLQITDVRVERLQEITEQDALAEGVTALDGEFAGCFASYEAMSGTTARECYARYWDALNYQRGEGWDTNPWVWIYTFHRVEA